MKTLTTFVNESFILESKQVGILYHYSSISNIVNILKTGILKDKTYNRGYISFTRNGNGIVGQGANFARIVIDGNNLSNKYSIVPDSQAISNGIKLDIFKPSERRQQEERIYEKEVNIGKSIICIEIIDDYAKIDLTNDERQIIETHTTLNIVHKFKTYK